ncbi:hypothetical protein KM043_005488 [Ampulex compressa]|nr:hypothetical protein KM043_005488 [Ampulex compressa]
MGNRRWPKQEKNEVARDYSGWTKGISPASSGALSASQLPWSPFTRRTASRYPFSSVMSAARPDRIQRGVHFVADGGEDLPPVLPPPLLTLRDILGLVGTFAEVNIHRLLLHLLSLPLVLPPLLRPLLGSLSS